MKMDSESPKDSATFIHEGTSVNKVGKMNSKISNVSEMQLNSKDELNWVENEIIVDANDVTDKCATGYNESNVVKEVDCPSVEIHKNATKPTDVNEEKLWEYFSEHNSSQLRCNLCSGLFLYQSNASHLLRHIEAAHNLPVLPPSNKDVETVLVSMRSASSSDVRNADILNQQSCETLKTKVEDSQSGKKIAACSVALGAARDYMFKRNEKARHYFTVLESGKIRCNLCCRVLSNHTNKFTMLKHLNFNHADIYRLIEDASNRELKSDESLNDKSPISRLWDYFKNVGATGRIRCNYCNILLKYREGNNTNLIKHLKTKHKSIFSNKEYKFNNPIKKDCLNVRNKNTTSIILEIIQEGNKCLITSAQLLPESNQIDFAKLSNTSKLNNQSRLEPLEGLELEENCYPIGSKVNNECINKKDKLKIWDYFTKLRVNHKVRCSICSEIIYCRNSTMKLYNHLVTRHKTNVDVAQESDKNVYLSYELTVDDISNINLSSILNAEKSNNFNKIKKNLIRKRNTINYRLWKYYTKLYRSKAVCKICDKTFPYKLGQTSQLVKHLHIQHNALYSKVNTKLVKEKPNSNNLNQILNRINKHDVWKFFTKIDYNKAQCDLCNDVNVLHYSSRSVLLKHLRHRHKYFLDLKCYNKNRLLKRGNVIQSDSKNSNKSLTEDNNLCDTPGINMRTLFNYFISDKNLEKCIKFEREQIICKLCTGTFLCNDLLNFEYTIKYHIQTCHADSLSVEKSLFLDNISEDDSKTSNELDDDYNELEAITDGINSYAK